MTTKATMCVTHHSQCTGKPCRLHGGEVLWRCAESVVGSRSYAVDGCEDEMVKVDSAAKVEALFGTLDHKH